MLGSFSTILEYYDSDLVSWHIYFRGAFQLEEGGKLPDYCCRIQAHLSTCASSKVLEQVPKFHPELLLKEVPHLDIWPVQFQKNCPTENDIALYFFAEDLPRLVTPRNAPIL